MPHAAPDRSTARTSEALSRLELGGVDGEVHSRSHAADDAQAVRLPASGGEGSSSMAGGNWR
jgi:hypothetical protein